MGDATMAGTWNWRERPGSFAWASLLALLIVGLPVFVRRAPGVDATLYDVAARNVLRGGTAYHEVFDTNFPGMLWAHVAIRALFGWSSEALRTVDFAVFALIVWLLGGWSRRIGASATGRIWVSAVLICFYFWLPDWAHVQRDVWMLAPCLLALELRWSQYRAQSDDIPGASIFLRSFIEGACWTAAAWLKPFVLIPAVACWLAAAAYSRGRSKFGARLAWDVAGLAAGAVTIGAAGIIWLMRSGAWPYFLEVLFSWDPEYGGPHVYHWHWRRDGLLGAWNMALPWNLVHVVAVPLAAWSLWTLYGGAGRRDPEGHERPRSIAIIAALYLAWTLQFALVQPLLHPFAFLPSTFIALTFVSSVPVQVNLSGVPGKLLLVPLIAWGIDSHPLFDVRTVAEWYRCVTAGSTAALRDQLSGIRHGGPIQWKNLDRTAAFLREQGVRDKDVLCLNNTSHYLYLLLDIDPPIPYMHVDQILTVFPLKRDRLRRELAAARPRFVVSDLSQLRVPDTAEGLTVDGLSHVSLFHTTVFPWHYPAVFRAGQFVVHRVTGPAGRIWPYEEP